MKQTAGTDVTDKPRATTPPKAKETSEERREQHRQKKMFEILNDDLEQPLSSAIFLLGISHLTATMKDLEGCRRYYRVDELMEMIGSVYDLNKPLAADKPKAPDGAQKPIQPEAFAEKVGL